MLATVDAEKSECWKPGDKIRIFDAVRKTVGFEELNSIVFSKLRVWMIAEASKEVDWFSDDYSIKINYQKFSLASLYNTQGRYNEAEPLYVECLQKRNGAGRHWIFHQQSRSSEL
jgi:hypothetical protein